MGPQAEPLRYPRPARRPKRRRDAGETFQANRRVGEGGTKALEGRCSCRCHRQAPSAAPPARPAESLTPPLPPHLLWCPRASRYASLSSSHTLSSRNGLPQRLTGRTRTRHDDEHPCHPIAADVRQVSTNQFSEASPEDHYIK